MLVFSLLEILLAAEDCHREYVQIMVRTLLVPTKRQNVFLMFLIAIKFKMNYPPETYSEYLTGHMTRLKEESGRDWCKV